MTTALTDLPDDIDALKAMVLSMSGEVAALRAINADAEARIARLHALLKALERARYGRRSERLTDDQLDFAFDEIETGLAGIEAELDKASPSRRANARRDRARFCRPILSVSNR